MKHYKFQVGYVAGVFDERGFCRFRNKGKNLEVTLRTWNAALVKFLCKEFGGSTYLDAQDAPVLSLAGRDAEDFLLWILPHLSLQLKAVQNAIKQHNHKKP